MQRPNILVFMTDHQRGDTVLPEHPCRTPHLDRFAEEGVVFDQAFCPAPHCCPARATFMSGLYPTRTGIWNNVLNARSLGGSLADGVRFWSEDLADAGYAMRFTGKWHVALDEGPEDRGWVADGASAVGDGTEKRPGWDRYRALADEPVPETRGEGEFLRPGYPPYRLYGTCERHHHDEAVSDRAADWIRELAGGDAPWCVFAGCTGPHDPYWVPQRYLDMLPLEDVPLPPSYGDELADKPRIYHRLRRQVWGQLSEREVREAIRHFWALCSYLDDLFGRLLDALDATGQAGNTLVLYVSDHGDYCGDHGLFCKGIAAFRGAYHVPAVVRWPEGVATPGRRVSELVSLADFAPTFLEAAGLAPAPDRAFTGASLLPFLQGRTPDDWRDAICVQCDGVELYYTQRAVWTREWKYVFNGFDEDELYHIAEDPDELQNLARDAQHDPVKRDLCRKLWRFAAEEGDTAINPYVTVGLAPYGPAEAFRD